MTAVLPACATTTGLRPRGDLDYPAALATATAWSDGGYSETSRSYWSGMRDTLRVVVGLTVTPPVCSSDDAAAATMLSGRPRLAVPASGTQPRRDLDYAGALAQAMLWADGGYSATSRAYWSGMRDTLRVVVGLTSAPPSCSVDDAAATTLLPLRSR